MDSLAYDVVLLPTSALARRAIALSEQLSLYDSLFTLTDGSCFPHVSLYMVQIASAHLAEVSAALQAIAAQTQPLTLQAGLYYLSDEFHFLDVEYQAVEELSALTSQVLETVNPLRDGMREKDKARMAEATGLALENYQKYGHKAIGELFRPHMTFTRFTADQSKLLEKLPPVEEFTGEFERIGLFEMGEHGTCIRKVAEFRLNG